MAAFLKKLGSQQQKGLLKFPCLNFPLYEVISFGSVIIELAVCHTLIN